MYSEEKCVHAYCSRQMCGAAYAHWPYWHGDCVYVNASFTVDSSTAPLTGAMVARR